MPTGKLKIHPVIQLRTNASAFGARTKSAAKMRCRVHFIGIGGIGVSALARYYLEKGHRVSGSDLASSEITEALKKNGARIIIGPHKKENFPKTADLVIYSPAVQKSNPELKQAYQIQNTKYNIQVLSYPEALGELTRQYFTIAVSGTHGKSTTTAMLSLILIKAGLNPAVIIGTKLKEFNNTNFHPGGKPDTRYQIPRRRTLGSLRGRQNTKYLLIEADEHFASFLNYWPKMIVLTNIDADHLDFYKTLNNIKKTFKKYISHLPENGILIANRDDKNTYSAIPTAVKNIRWFSSQQPEAKKLKKILKIPGDHMVSDALAALTAARALGVPDKTSFLALSKYQGAWRRFEIIKKKPFVLISDYGHNPAKMLAALKGAREKYPNRKIWCVYQPHQYQRTHFLFKEFVKAFRAAPTDNIIITDIYDVAGREKPRRPKESGLRSRRMVGSPTSASEPKASEETNSEKLVDAINKSSVIYLPKEKIVNHLNAKIKSGRLRKGEPRSKGAGDVVIIMGAGDIYKLCDELK